MRFDPGPVVLEGRFPESEGVDALYSPRRTVLDAILVAAAREAGADVREHFVVDDVTTSDGRVTGMRGRDGGRTTAARAKLVIGADGKHSLLAKTVGAPIYHQRPPFSTAYYTYWEGVALDGGEMYGRGRRMISAWPTNDGLAMTYVAWLADEFRAFRADIERNFLQTLDLAGDLGDRVRAGRRADRFYGTADLPSFFRRPYGPGWALVGDAGLVMDPITAQGIGNAFRDAELLAAAVVAGFAGGSFLDRALASYQEERHRAALPMYEVTTDPSALAPPTRAQERLFRSLVGRHDEIDRLFGVMTGAVPIAEYFSVRNLIRLIGINGLSRMVLQKLRPGRADPQDGFTLTEAQPSPFGS